MKRLKRLRTHTLITAILFATVLKTVGVAEPYTPSGAERKAILDALREPVSRQLEQPVEFVVEKIAVSGEWAFVILQPQRPGGGKIEYAYTRYQAAVDEGIFGAEVIALLRQTPKGWLTYEYELGSTDVPWVDWPSRYPVPAEIFPH